MSEPFVKMHGLGNDFVILDRRKGGGTPTAAFCCAVADRRYGVGCDQLIVLMRAGDARADLFMRIYNPDGSEAGACGNASRCVARLLFAETGKRQAVIQTISGLLPVWVDANDIISVDFGVPSLTWDRIPLAREMDTRAVPLHVDDLRNPCCVNVGNPHAVFFVPDATAVPIGHFGPRLERHLLFPERTNVEVATILDRSHIRMRVWERGAGITMACGSAACATLVAAVRLGLSDTAAEIIMDGGSLLVEWRETDHHVLLSGPTASVFTGVWQGEE